MFLIKYFNSPSLLTAALCVYSTGDRMGAWPALTTELQTPFLLISHFDTGSHEVEQAVLELTL